VGLALVATLAITALLAEGLLDTGWIYLFSEGIGEDGMMVGTGKPWIVLALILPVVGYLVAPDSTRWLRKLLVLIAIPAFLLSGVDVLLRLPNRADDFPPRWLPRLPWVARFDPNLDVRGESSGNLWRIAGEPSLREPHQIIFQTDAAGFRNTHGGEAIDLLVLGDSFGAGENTTQDRIFARLLETKYGRRVYNLSFPGSPYEEYLNFLIESPRITFERNARLIWTFYTGDLYDAYGNIWDADALPWQDGLKAWATAYRTFRSRSPIRRQIIALRWRLLGNVRGQTVIQRELANGQPVLFNSLQEEQGLLPQDLVEHHPNFPMLERTMVEMRNRAAERGLDLTVVLLPTKGEVYRWILTQRGERRPEDADPSGFALAVLDACRRVRMRCLDTKPDLIKEGYRLFDSSGALLYWRDDPHLNDSGHEAVAAFIAREILPRSGATLHRRANATW
jgi:hypothetical protein